MVVKPIKFFIFVAILEIEYFRIFDYMLQNNSGLFGSIPVVTKNLLIINLLFFLADQLLSQSGFMTRYLALHFFMSDSFMPHQLITYMFMHGSIGHIFFNMFAVFMFGRTLETVWGPKRFLTYYLITGIGAALLQLLISYLRYKTLLAEIPVDMIPSVINQIQTEGASLLHQNLNYTDSVKGALNLVINVPMVGASGAVFGILLGFGMLFPNAELFIIPIPFPIKAKFFVIGYGVLELVLGVTDRAGDNVAHFAHLGGLLTGLILVLYWKMKGTLHGKFF